MIRCWQHGKRILAQLEGIEDCDSADTFRDMKIYVPRDEVELAEDEFLWADLIGCKVYDGETLLGKVKALEEYGAQDNLVVVGGSEVARPGEWLLPFIAEVIESVDLEAGRIDVSLPEGMDACFTPRF